jgi:hypothetical protein
LHDEKNARRDRRQQNGIADEMYGWRIDDDDVARVGDAADEFPKPRR